ncbi:MAG: hypothetical protein COS34_00675 [Lysobacterales bacterium CG02_land_8_20_14_3_00_62_12]|nr:MAG: hypothetical protein COS34_00675 [Xanthomonadales bacterium CG02_land_8_20_14_3_00_62_12]
MRSPVRQLIFGLLWLAQPTLAQPTLTQPTLTQPTLAQSALAETTPPAAPLAPFELQFDVARNGKVQGEASVHLRQNPDQSWEFETFSRGTRGAAAFIGVKIRETSVFRWQQSTPQTLRYAYSQKVGFSSRARSFQVDPEQHWIRGRDADGPFELRDTVAVVDRHLLTLAIASDLQAGKSEFRYQVANKHSISEYRYEVTGKESILLGGQPLETVRVERIRSNPGRVTTVWIAPARGYLPVRTLQVEPDGETIEMTLR